MANATIVQGETTITVAFIRGRIPPLGMGVKEITRPGVNGHAYKQIGNRAGVADLLVEKDVSSAENAASLVTDLAAFKGTDPVTVTYNDGQSVENVQVLDVTPVSVKKVATPVGGVQGGDWYVQVRLTVQRTA